MTPSITVVIPCFNAGRYIAATLKSVLAQDIAGLEVVVVDDGSSDRSAALVRQNFPAVRLIEQANQGVASARNLGLHEARGEWVAFIDADDLWLPGKLQAQFELLRRNTRARMACTAWQVWTSIDPEPPAAYLAELRAQAGDVTRWQGPSGWIYPELLLDCVVWTSTVLAHRSVFEEVGVFDPDLRIGEDYDLWLRASRVTPILRAGQPYALYRMHPASITKGAPEANYGNVVVSRALARWGYAGPDGRSADKADVDRARAGTWSEFAAAHLAAGNIDRAREASLEAIRIDRWSSHGWRVLAKTMARSLLPGAPARR